MATVEGGFSSLSGTGLYSDNTNGRIGIGTSTLNHRLAVDDTGTIGGIKVESDSSQALTVEKQDGTILLRIDGNFSIESDGGGIRIRPVTNNETGSLRVTPKGNPTGGSLGRYTRAQLRCYYTESTSSNIESISLESNYNKYQSSPDAFNDPRYYIKTRAEGTGSHYPLTFQIGGNDIVTLTTDNKMGIGTTSPTQKLELNGASNQDLFFLLNGANDFRIGYSASDTKLRIQDNTTDRMVIDSSGNVGIGTASSNSKLHVGSGDMETSGAGNGLIVKTPDGTHTYRIHVANNGTVTSTQIT